MSDLREMIERVRGELQEYGVYRPRLSPQELDRLLAVAEAACEWVEANERFGSFNPATVRAQSDLYHRAVDQQTGQ